MKEYDILKQFDIAGEPAACKQLTCGNINRTFRIDLRQADGSITRCILQNVNVNVFKKPYELMQNICGVCAHLKEKVAAAGGDPLRETMTFADTADHTHLYLDEEGFYWRVYTFIEANSYQSADKPGLFYKAAKAFGKFQRQLADYPAETLYETIPGFHNTVSRFAAFQQAIADCKLPERLKEASAEIDAILSRESLAHVAVDAIADGSMPLRVTHNDTKLNNILMDPETDEGLCVIDLDTVMPGSVLYDFGDAIRFGASTAAEDEPDVSKIALDLDKFAEFAEGFLAGTDGALTEKELSLLPEGAMLLTYEQAMRFLTDYLNGDTYFKINYPEHNIVRTRAQLALLFDMEAKRDGMHEIINKQK
ncbi:MAG: aminoglycoside phosphotransferase family protein [Clostridia bacterium]|nr:aminoglycoside phosphotransferase family protein [Clostridia bacterium]